MESVLLVVAPPGKGKREGGLLNIFTRLELTPLRSMSDFFFPKETKARECYNREHLNIRD